VSAREPCWPATVPRASEALATRLLFAFLLILPTVGASLAAPPVDPGISRALANWRASRYTDIRYAISARVADSVDRLTLDVTVDVSLESPNPIVLDWRPTGGAPATLSAVVNGKPRVLSVGGDHVIVDAAFVHAGTNTLSFSVEAAVGASGTAITRFRDQEDGSDYLYTLLVPADASTVFPCFDQPDLKARFALSLDAPDGWTVVGNAPLREVGDAIGGRRVHAFRETEPISTYQFAFAAGPFVALQRGDDDTRLFVRRSRRVLGETHGPAILEANRRALDWVSQWLERPFPFAKYDLVVIPELPYGGMEHAGATFLREAAVLFPGAPSVSESFRRAQLIFHETAHQWLGDLVTMRWFDDLWLKEGFANFAAAKIAEATMPETAPWVAFHGRKSEAYRIDGSAGTTAIRQPVDNLMEAKASYGPVVYEKAPGLLRQLEFALSEETFRAGVKRWMDAHAYGSTDWRDLVRDLGAAAGRDLETTIAPWVDEEGMPEIRLERSADGRVTVVAEDLLGRGRHWPQSIRLRSYAPGRAPCDTTVVLAGKATAFEPTSDCRDTELWLLNAGDYGYGRFRLRSDEVDAAFRWAGDAVDPLDRALLWEALWEEVRDSRMPPSAFVERVLGALGRESNALVEAQLLARIEFVWRHWMSVGQRAALGSLAERTLLAMASDGPDLARRVAAMRSLIAMAATPETRALVHSWLRGVAEPPAPWQVRDAFAVVRTLMAAEVPGAEADLEFVVARAAGGDDARRQAYSAGASAPRQSVKRAYFESWLRDASIPEAWTEDALGPLNTPDHHLVTQPLLREALDAVPVLSRTHKIFFVNRWLEAFSGGQRTAEAAALLRTAAANTDLPLSLRRKMLLVLEPLERTVRIRERWATQ